MTADFEPVRVAQAGRDDDHLLHTLVNLGSKAEGWLRYLYFPRSLDLPAVDWQFGTLKGQQPVRGMRVGMNNLQQTV